MTSSCVTKRTLQWCVPRGFTAVCRAEHVGKRRLPCVQLYKVVYLCRNVDTKTIHAGMYSRSFNGMVVPDALCWVGWGSECTRRVTFGRPVVYIASATFESLIQLYSSQTSAVVLNLLSSALAHWSLATKCPPTLPVMMSTVADKVSFLLNAKLGRKPAGGRGSEVVPRGNELDVTLRASVTRLLYLVRTTDVAQTVESLQPGWVPLFEDATLVVWRRSWCLVMLGNAVVLTGMLHTLYLWISCASRLSRETLSAALTSRHCAWRWRPSFCYFIGVSFLFTSSLSASSQLRRRRRRVRATMTRKTTMPKMLMMTTIEHPIWQNSVVRLTRCAPCEMSWWRYAAAHRAVRRYDAVGRRC